MELAQGRSVAEVCRSLGVTEQTYYRWRKEDGGLKMDQAKRLKVLEQENTRLRRAELVASRLITEGHSPISACALWGQLGYYADQYNHC